jgi:predicted anti-sigma-YlaC factor YlaD
MSSGDRERPPSRISGDALSEHVSECSECSAAGEDVADVRAALGRARLDLNAALLSRRVAEMVAPELARIAAKAFRRRVALCLLLALIPLPLVLAYDAFVLRLVFGLLSSLLPQAVVLYLVASMALTGLLVIASVYAAIPLLVHRQIVAHGGRAA